MLGDTAAVATVPVPARRARSATGRGRRVGVTTVRKTAGLGLPPRGKQGQPRSCIVETVRYIAHQNSLELQELEPVGFEGWAGVECVGVE